MLLSHNNVPETALAGSRVLRACKDLGERRTGKRTALWVAAVSANGPGGALLTPSCRATLGPWLVDIEMVSAQSAECMALTTHHLLLTVNSAKVPTTSPASVARQERLLGRGNGGCWGLVRSWESTGDVTSESVVLVVRTTRSGCPCLVGGITTTTSAGGRPFVSRARPPAQAGSRATDGSISPCSASSPWVSARLSNREGSLGSALRGRLAAGEEASRRVSGRCAGHAQTGGLEKASAPQRGAEPW